MADEVTLQVGPELAGQRLDKAIASLLEVSRTTSRSLVDEGVTVDGSPARASDRVRAGSVIVTPALRAATSLEPEPVEFRVVYEDDEVIVVDKPPGLVVHPGSGRRTGTLASGLLYRYPELEGVGTAERWGLVHRLDKDTSGVLLVGRTDLAYQALVEQLRKREIGRRYTTLVDGFLDAPTGTIDAPIGRDPSRPTRRAVVATGKPARTHFELEEVFEIGNASLLTVTLETGRTHQIRVHLSAIDHPVIGDRLYGRRPTNVTSSRVFLHASSLTFTHPVRAEKLVVESPLAPDLVGVLDDLRSGGSE